MRICRGVAGTAVRTTAKQSAAGRSSRVRVCTEDKSNTADLKKEAINVTVGQIEPDRVDGMGLKKMRR